MIPNWFYDPELSGKITISFQTVVWHLLAADSCAILANRKRAVFFFFFFFFASRSYLTCSMTEDQLTDPYCIFVTVRNTLQKHQRKNRKSYYNLLNCTFCGPSSSMIYAASVTRIKHSSEMIYIRKNLLTDSKVYRLLDNDRIYHSVYC